MQQYHEFVKNAKRSNDEPASPVEVAINKNDVWEVEKVVLNAYCHDTPELPGGAIKASPYWGFLHDVISKFGKEFNRLYICGTDESYELINVPYHLSKMKGKVTGFDLGLCLFLKLSGW